MWPKKNQALLSCGVTCLMSIASPAFGGFDHHTLLHWLPEGLELTPGSEPNLSPCTTHGRVLLNRGELSSSKGIKTPLVFQLR